VTLLTPAHRKRRKVLNLERKELSCDGIRLQGKAKAS
jgi:hypothetical protein